ncbi:hypothetical protein RAS1_03190 [Phycisphaerae bacterium RAS1]|nr:hypothetical protein RAS1_03190 [Phycisphaerae bacterium RAS1]
MEAAALEPIPELAARRARSAPAAIRLACTIAVCAAALAYWKVGTHHIAKVYPDFEYFYKGGAWLYQHGALDAGYDRPAPGRQLEPRGTIEWYWPVVSRLMTLLAWRPYDQAGVLWVTANVVILVMTLRLVGRRLLGLPPEDWAVTTLVPLLTLTMFWYWEFKLNQIDNLTLLLLVGSFACWQAGRRGIAGFWLGLAVLLKITPGLLVIWFLLKRQFRTVAVAGLTILLAGPAGDLIVFGPERTADFYAGWLHTAATQSSHRGLVLEQREMDWRNQGLGAILSRWLHATNWNTHFDNEPRAQDEREPSFMNVVNLPAPRVAQIATAATACIAAGLCILARRPAARLSAWQLRFEFALFLLAMLWLMPVMRRYHIIWALPAIALLGAGIHHLGLRRAWSWLALGAIGLLVLAQPLLALQHAIGRHELEAAGALQLCVMLLGLPLIFLIRSLAAGRDPHVWAIGRAGEEDAPRGSS